MCKEKIENLSKYMKMTADAKTAIAGIPERLKACQRMVEDAKLLGFVTISDGDYHELRGACVLALGMCTQIEAWEKGAKDEVSELSHYIAADQVFHVRDKDVEKLEKRYDKVRRIVDGNKVDEFVEKAKGGLEYTTALARRILD